MEFPTTTEQLCVRRLLKHNDSWSETGQRHVEPTAAGQGPQLRGKVLEVGPGGTAQELEHVVVKTLGSSSIHNDVRHRQHLEENRDEALE